MGPVCTTPWASSDPAHPFVLLEGVGVNIDANNAKGIKNISCQIYRHTSEPVWALDMFTEERVQVTLLSIEGTCAAFGLTDCPRRGGNGTAIFGEHNAPGGCWWGDEMTTDWRRHVMPSGLDLLVCKFPARRPE